MSPSVNILSPNTVSHLADFKRSVADAVPGVEKLILFGSRARGQMRDDSDYDVAVIVRDGVFIRPIPLSPDYLAPTDGHAAELADEIARVGIEIT